MRGGSRVRLATITNYHQRVDVVKLSKRLYQTVEDGVHWVFRDTRWQSSVPREIVMLIKSSQKSRLNEPRTKIKSSCDFSSLLRLVYFLTLILSSAKDEVADMMLQFNLIS